MKKRAFTLLNFLAFNVLFFALYLNFIQKDTNEFPAVSAASHVATHKLTAPQAKNEVAARLQQKQQEAAPGN